MTTTPFAGLEDKQAARNRHNRPNGPALAAEARTGITVPQLAQKCGCAEQRIYTALREAGFTAQGENRAHVERTKLAARIAEVDFLQSDEGWMDDRACDGHDPELWYSDSKWNQRNAKAICGACPVQTACLTYALRIEAASSNNYRWGVWGNTTPDERKALVNGK